MGRLSEITAITRSLSGRLVLGALGIHAVLLPLMFIGVLQIVKQGYEAQFVEDVRSEAFLFANMVAEQGLSKENLHDLLEEAVTSGHVVSAQILTKLGKITATAGRQTIKTPFEEDFSFGQHGDNRYHIAIPIQEGPRRGATLRLAYDETATRDQIQLTYRRGVYLAAIYVALSLILVFLWTYMVNKPLQHLRKAARRITNGRFDEPLDIASPLTELKSLAQDLDDMRRKLVKQASDMEHQATHDSLTGLPNRTLLYDRLQQTLLMSQRNKYNFALLLIDLDRFKEVNDTLGHHSGDLLLKEITSRLKQAVRRSDTVARLGGDEFALILPMSDPVETAHVAGRITEILEAPCTIENQSLHVSASLGIASYPEHGTRVEELMRRADVAMYAAKRSGDHVTVYRDELDRHSKMQLLMTGELGNAIRQRELKVYYQPQLDLQSGEVCGAEALVRWHHPRNGLVPPDEFIHLAEKTGLIDALTQLVLSESTLQYAAWQKNGQQFSVAVNLSARNLYNQEFLTMVNDALTDSGVSRPFLVLELTESALFTDLYNHLEILNRVKSLQVSLSIDDFGTGYSSLAYLRQLPVSELKIDRSFISDLTHNNNDAAIVQATIDLAHHLGLRVVAEGVENAKTIKMLQAFNCDRVQGYYISQPLPAEEFEQWLQHYRQGKAASKITKKRYR